MSLRDFTLHDQIERNAWLHGSRTAFVADGQHISHAEYAARTARLAAGLAAAGVVAGDRVAILAPNGLAFVDLFGAAARLGAIVVPVNWRLAAEEVAYVLQDTAPRVLIVAPGLCPLPADLMPAEIDVYTLGASPEPAWRELAALYREGPPPPAAELDSDAGLVIIHTAAVAGRPRGALLSHGGLLASAARSLEAGRLTPDDVLLGVLPLFHLAGLSQWLAVHMAGGSTLLLPRFEAQAMVRAIDDDGASVMGSFPPMLGALLDAAAAVGSRLARLRVVTGLEAPETIARFVAACPQAEFWVGYGQTETSGMVTMARSTERPGSAGRPVAQHVVAIVDELDQPVAPGTSGEIVVRGAMVFRGYWGCEADNAATLRDGWHHTGDLGRFDADGHLWYVGRSPAKELIKPGGENVYPAEVERALLEHPALAQAVVFGVPDAQWGEAIKAVCVLKTETLVDADTLIEFVGQRIARYKKPKHVVFVPGLPTLASGAPDRAAVRAAHGSTEGRPVFPVAPT